MADEPIDLPGTDDVGAAAQAAAKARLDNTGQSCNAAKRFIVVDELYDEFLARFSEALSAATPGDPTSEDTAIGPLSSKTAADRFEDQVKRAVEDGAEVLIGGKREGNFYESTILTGIRVG